MYKDNIVQVQFLKISTIVRQINFHVSYFFSTKS